MQYSAVCPSQALCVPALLPHILLLEIEIWFPPLLHNTVWQLHSIKTSRIKGIFLFQLLHTDLSNLENQRKIHFSYYPKLLFLHLARVKHTFVSALCLPCLSCKLWKSDSQYPESFLGFLSICKSHALSLNNDKELREIKIQIYWAFSILNIWLCVIDNLGNSRN